MASKYINRYNALFLAAYRNAENIIRRRIDTVLTVTNVDYFYNIKDIKEVGLVVFVVLPTYFLINTYNNYVVLDINGEVSMSNSGLLLPVIRYNCDSEDSDPFLANI